MDDVAFFSAALRAIRNTGAKIAIDDFGTGYSSLAYLEQFPVDVLKIDQSFVQGIVPFDGAPLVRAVIAMGKSLGCKVVAEGVETTYQFAYLRAEHCDEGQGFHFSPAVAAPAFAELLSRSPFVIPL